MATLIPETIRATATNGEKELSKLLKRLPEDWTIYYEPTVDRRKPDFVILAPNLGLLVIEVKDWSINSVLSVNPQTIELQPIGTAASFQQPNPLTQVEGYWQALKDMCCKGKYGGALLHAEGDHKGKLCFPVGAMVLFTRIERRNVEKSVHKEALQAIFTTENTVFADQRRAWNELDEAGLVAALKPFFRPFLMKQTFTAHQIDILRWVLFPESRLDVILGRDPLQSVATMEVLDTRQEQHAKSLGSGHYVLSGVAGSGKTVLLMARARWLAAKHPEKRSLLLCFNKVLAEWLKARMRDCPNVTVTHFDGWAKSVGLTRKETDDAVFGARVLSAITKRGDAAREWDSVLIDEAQDFEPTWFQCALAVMKDPVEGDLIIVADGSQRLYKRNKVSWSALGIQVVGRSISARFDLDKNYRNTPHIATLARIFSADERNVDGINSVGVGPQSCRRVPVGSDPTFVRAKNHADQVEDALKIVSHWLKGERKGKEFAPIRPEDIGVFYPRLFQGERPLMQRLVDGLSTLAETRWLNADDVNEPHLAVNDAAIKVQTIHSSKGLQYKAVIVLWADQLSNASATAEEDRRQLYVAITRAENDLVLLGNNAKGFSDELSRECKVRSSADLAVTTRSAS